MIKVAFYCTSKARGGLEMNLVKTANIIRGKVEIVIITVKDSLIFNEAKKLNLKCITISKPNKYFDIISAFKLSNIIRKNKIKHLVVFDNKDTDCASMAKLFHRKFKLYYHQNMHIGGNKKDFFHTLRYNRFDVWISPLKILAKEVEELTNFPRERVRVVHIGVDQMEFFDRKPKDKAKLALGIDPEQFVVGIMGRIDEQKGQMTALEAMTKIKEKDIVLIIVGEPTIGEGDVYFAKMKEYIDANNLSDRVKTINFTNLIADIYSAMDVFLLTSFSETYGLVTIEAMMAQVPILATRSGGTIEITDNGKYAELFTPKDSDELAHKITKMYYDYNVYQANALITEEYALDNFSKRSEREILYNLFLEQENG